MAHRLAQPRLRELRTITVAALLAALAWTLVIGASLAWNYWHEEEEHRSLARLETRLGLPHQQIVGHIENDRSLLGGLGATHGAIWLAGVGMIGFIRSRARRQIVTRRDDLRRRRVSEQVFDQTAEGIVITDLERRIISVNRAFSEITGYTAEEALGRHPEDLLRSGRHDPEIYRQIETSLAGQGSWRGEMWHRRKSG